MMQCLFWNFKTLSDWRWKGKATSGTKKKQFLMKNLPSSTPARALEQIPSQGFFPSTLVCTKHDSEMFFSSFPFWLLFSHILVHLSSHSISSCHLRERSFNWITTELGEKGVFLHGSNSDGFISWRFPIYRFLVSIKLAEKIRGKT